jgi:ABC-type glycerol-3-phosphate transport system substrate-binding protein
VALIRSVRGSASIFAGGRSFSSVLAAIVLLSGLFACSNVPFVPTATPASSSRDAPTLLPGSTVTEVPSQFATPIASPSLAGNQPITLTVWVPEQFSPEAAQSGEVLTHQLAEFEQAEPTTAVKFVLKSPYGKGGLLDFLDKVQSLVPDRLPDLIMLDSREVDAAARTGLLQRLDRDLPSGAFADLLPPAQALAMYDGQWLTLPLTLNVQHLAYNAKVVPQAPATWDEVLKSGAPFAFPADDDDAFLFQYLENKGRIADSRQPAPLNVSVTTSVLTFFQRARTANLVPDSVLAVKTVHDVWPLFAEGQVPLAQVEASDYIAGHDHVPNASFAPLPTQDGVTTTLVSGWNYAIITQEPRRHAAAAAFLSWIDEPSRLAEWASVAQVVPARRSAFAISVGPREYGDFLLNLLDGADVAPTFADRAAYAGSWTSALQAVLRGQATPGEAALKAAQALSP